MEYEHSAAMAEDFRMSQAAMVQSFQETQTDLAAPHVKMRPKVYKDGDQWCCLYGENLMEGVCGFGATPAAACAAFDAEWWHGNRRENR